MLSSGHPSDSTIVSPSNLLTLLRVRHLQSPKLPPLRGKNVSIEHIENAKSQCRGLYRMSVPELKEVKKIVDELIEQGFIRSSKTLGSLLSYSL